MPDHNAPERIWIYIEDVHGVPEAHFGGGPLAGLPPRHDAVEYVRADASEDVEALADYIVMDFMGGGAQIPGRFVRALAEAMRRQDRRRGCTVDQDPDYEWCIREEFGDRIADEPQETT